MKVDFKVEIKDMDGNIIREDSKINQEQIVVEPGTGNAIFLNTLFSSILVGDSHKDSGLDPLDVYDWGLELRKTGVIDIPPSAVDNVKKFIKTSDKLPVSTKGQLLKCFKE